MIRNALPLFLLLAGPATAHSLFDPVPDAEMREMTTDRPDRTESPYTIDAGHLQLESDIVNDDVARFHRKNTDERHDTLAIGTTNARLGLTDADELDVIVEPYLRVHDADRIAGDESTRHGFGDVVIRWKHNFFGNDGGESSLGILPFVKLPTNTDDVGNDRYEGGVIVPYAFKLAKDWNLEMMTEADLAAADGPGYDGALIQTASLGWQWSEAFGSYAELYGRLPTSGGDDTEASFDFGLTWQPTDDSQFDVGINLGLTEATDDYNPFVGYSVRF